MSAGVCYLSWPTIPLPAWTGTAAFLATLLTMTLLPLVMFWWIRRRGWM